MRSCECSRRRRTRRERAVRDARRAPPRSTGFVRKSAQPAFMACTASRTSSCPVTATASRSGSRRLASRTSAMPSSPGITMSVRRRSKCSSPSSGERLLGGGGGARGVPGVGEHVAEQLLEEPLVVDDEDPAGRHARGPSRPSKTRSAGPRIVTRAQVLADGDLERAAREPHLDGRRRPATAPARNEATAAAHAPVPQASVSPAPRSQTTRSMPAGPGRAKPDVHAARDGALDRRPDRARALAGGRVEQDRVRVAHRDADRAAASRRRRGSPPRPRRAPAPSRPRRLDARRRRRGGRCSAFGPESVSMTSSPERPRVSARWRATQRTPFPHIAATEPSEL